MRVAATSSLTLESITSLDRQRAANGANAGASDTMTKPEKTTEKTTPASTAASDSAAAAKKLSPYVVQVGDAQPSITAATTHEKRARPSSWRRAVVPLRRRQNFSAKLAALLKHRTVRLSAAAATHELALQNLRRTMFAQRAAHLEDEKAIAFEFTQRLQTLVSFVVVVFVGRGRSPFYILLLLLC